MRALVTGASGFLGSYVVRALSDKGFEVHGTGLGEASVPGLERFHVVDLAQAASVVAAFALSRPEVVVHLAGFSSAGRSWTEREECFRVNVEGTRAILEAAAGVGARVVLASTAEVYGQAGAADAPLQETVQLAPVSPYGQSKAEAEELALGAGGVVARVFSVVGAGQADTFVVPSFVGQMVGGKRELTVGNLDVRRDFVHPADAGAAFAVLAERGESKAYNIATGVSRSLREVVQLLERLAGYSVELVIDRSRFRPADPLALRGDAARLRGLGWAPRFDLADALSEMWMQAVEKARRGCMKVLVTGGTGFLGRRTVERLAGEHQVRLLVRGGSARDRFPDGVEFALGDVTDPASLERAFAGCDAVVHAAALVKILAPREEFDRINVGGLENVLAAAKAASVGRIVYVSSFIALGPTEHGPGGLLDESAGEPADPKRRWINDYERTKALSDRRARAAIGDGVPLSVVYPGVIYGPGELTEGNIVVRHIMDLVAKKLPGLLGKPERVWNYVFVEDVAEGIARTLERAPDGARYVLGGENVRQDEFYRLVGELTGAKVPTLRFPDAVAKMSGGLMKAWALWTNGVPQLTPDLVEIYRHDWAYDSARAARELDYQPRTFRAGLSETVAWLRTRPESGLKA